MLIFPFSLLFSFLPPGAVSSVLIASVNISSCANLLAMESVLSFYLKKSLFHFHFLEECFH